MEHDNQELIEDEQLEAVRSHCTLDDPDDLDLEPGHQPERVEPSSQSEGLSEEDEDVGPHEIDYPVGGPGDEDEPDSADVDGDEDEDGTGDDSDNAGSSDHVGGESGSHSDSGTDGDSGEETDEGEQYNDDDAPEDHNYTERLANVVEAPAPPAGRNGAAHSVGRHPSEPGRAQNNARMAGSMHGVAQHVTSHNAGGGRRQPSVARSGAAPVGSVHGVAQHYADHNAGGSRQRLRSEIVADDGRPRRVARAPSASPPPRPRTTRRSSAPPPLARRFASEADMRADRHRHRSRSPPPGSHRGAASGHRGSSRRLSPEFEAHYSDEEPVLWDTERNRPMLVDTVEFRSPQPVGAVVKYKDSFWRMETPFRGVRELRAGTPGMTGSRHHTPAASKSAQDAGRKADKLTIKRYGCNLGNWQTDDPYLIQFDMVKKSWQKYGNLMQGFETDDDGTQRMTEAMTYAVASVGLDDSMWNQVLTRYSDEVISAGLTLDQLEKAIFPNVREQIQAKREREAQSLKWDVNLSFAENKQKISALLKWCTRLSAGAKWDIIRDSLSRGNTAVYEAIFMSMRGHEVYNTEATQADFDTLWDDIQRVEAARMAQVTAEKPPAPSFVAPKSEASAERGAYQARKWARKYEKKQGTVAALPAVAAPPAAPPVQQTSARRQRKADIANRVMMTGALFAGAARHWQIGRPMPKPLMT